MRMLHRQTNHVHPHSIYNFLCHWDEHNNNCQYYYCFRHAYFYMPVYVCKSVGKSVDNDDVQY